MIESDLADSSLSPLDAARVVVLEWTQPRRTRRHWELRADGKLVATVTGRSFGRRAYTARTAGAEWTIVRSFLGRQRLHRVGTEAPVASARRSFRTVEIERAPAERLFWKRRGWTGSEHRLENGERFPLVSLRGRRGFLRTGGTEHLEDAGRSLPDLLPLLLLTWTLVLAEARGHAH